MLDAVGFRFIFVWRSLGRNDTCGHTGWPQKEEGEEDLRYLLQPLGVLHGDHEAAGADGHQAGQWAAHGGGKGVTAEKMLLHLEEQTSGDKSIPAVVCYLGWATSP